MKRIWVDAAKCLACGSCEIQCAVERNSVSRTLFEAAKEDPKPSANVAVVGGKDLAFALQCRHCEDARCISACPGGAMQRDEHGVVFVDANKCCGCWMCVMACPFGAVKASPRYKVAQKCDACRNMDQPACVAGCPTGALMLCDEAAYNELLRKNKNSIAQRLADMT